MNDQTIPAYVTPEDMEHARSYVQDFLDSKCVNDRTLAVARVLHALLPPPKRPTLADMTEAERRECQWMQADVYDTEGEWVIRESPHSNAVQLVNRAGKCLTVAAKDVTPRPDLPSLTWPGEQNPAPALPDGWRLADHKKYGRVVVTNTTPDIDGNVFFVAPTTGFLGNDWHSCAASELTYIDQEADQ